MNADYANKLINFACSHDGGTEQPRAYFDSGCNAVVVKSTVPERSGATRRPASQAHQGIEFASRRGKGA